MRNKSRKETSSSKKSAKGPDKISVKSNLGHHTGQAKAVVVVITYRTGRGISEQEKTANGSNPLEEAGGLNGDWYRATITNFFIPELNSHDVQELWFQQDGAICHTARATIDLLKDTFRDRLISRFGPVNWPARSCDLTPLDYFLWGYVKSLFCAYKPKTLGNLEDNIRRVIADIGPKMLEKSSKIGRPDWTTSEPAVAVLCQKSYIKCNAPRLSFE
ncbi:putative LOC100569746 [Trichonephila clavipes]|nr:putative LOC100569746 [Trichonephila clavipes]